MSNPLYSILLIGLLLFSCSKQESDSKLEESSQVESLQTTSPIKKSAPISLDELFPLTIEFGAIGMGAIQQPSTIYITKDSVRITKRSYEQADNVLSFPITQTQYLDLFSNFFKDDFTGEKHYYEPYAKDGGYMKVISKWGERKFSNVFLSSKNTANILPDTIGLSKVEPIYIYSSQQMRDLSRVH